VNGCFYPKIIREPIVGGLQMKLKLSLEISQIFPDMKTLIDLTAGLIGIAFDEISGVGKDADMPDNLTEIEGIGPAYAGRLNEAGTTTFSQFSELSVDQIREFMKLSESQGNPESWLEQARELR
jgi:hypothetical protein